MCEAAKVTNEASNVQFNCVASIALSPVTKLVPDNMNTTPVIRFNKNSNNKNDVSNKYTNIHPDPSNKINDKSHDIPQEIVYLVNSITKAICSSNPRTTEKLSIIQNNTSRKKFNDSALYKLL